MTLQDQIKAVLIKRKFQASSTDVSEDIGLPLNVMNYSLRHDGTCFQKLKGEAREQVARELHGKVSQECLARELGFNGNFPYQSLCEWRKRNGFDWAKKQGRRDSA